MATAEQLAAFNQAIAAGDYATAGSLASAAGYNPEQVAGYLNTSLGMNVTPDVVSGYMPSATVAAPTAEATTPSLVADYEGRQYNPTDIMNLYSQIVPLVDLSKLEGGVYNTSGESIGFNYDVGSQLFQNAYGRAPTSTEQTVMDMARYLINSGVTDVSQLTNTLTPGQASNFGVTYTGGGGTNYQVSVNPETGQLVFGTQGFETSDKDKILAAAALLGVGSFLGPSLFGAGAGAAGAGLGPIELAIAAGEGIVPLTAAQTATAGLTAAQLGALGSGIGLAEGAAAASSLFNAAKDSQIANMNLAATGGVDPLAGYLATGATPAVVNIGGSLYGLTPELVSAASAATGLPAGGPVTPPTTTAPGGAPGGGTTAPPGGLPPGITNTLTGLLTNPNTLASLLSLLGGGAALGGGGGGGGVGTLPTQGIPQNTPEYFNQVQGFLNQYLPGQMPNQANYLQSWYGSGGNAAMPPAPAPQGTAPAVPSSVLSSLFPGLMTPAPAAAPATAPAQQQVSDQQISDYVNSVLNNPNIPDDMKPTYIYWKADEYGLSYQDLADATGYSLEQVQNFLKSEEPIAPGSIPFPAGGIDYEYWRNQNT